MSELVWKRKSSVIWRLCDKDGETDLYIVKCNGYYQLSINAIEPFKSNPTILRAVIFSSLSLKLTKSKAERINQIIKEWVWS